MVSRAAAALSLALALAVPMAGAEGTSPHATPVRHRAVSQPLPQPKASAAGRRSAANIATHKAGKGTLAARGRSAAGRSHATVPAGMKAAGKSRGTSRRRVHVEPADVAPPPTMHIARASRSRQSETARVAAASSAPSKELTSDDFLQAASGPGDEPVAAATPAADAEKSVVVETPLTPGLKPVVNGAANVRAKVHSLAGRSVAAASAVSSLPEAKIGPDPDPAVVGDVPLSSRLDALNHPSREELTDEAVQPVILPGLYRNGRLVVPAPLKGTHEILVHQNRMADDEGLERIQDDEDLNRLRAAHQLVNFPESASLHVNPDLASDRRCARVWTVKFASDVARQFYARFHEPLQVNSAARTVAYQVKLQRVNGNAAGVGGDVASPHLTGQAIDLGKRGMSMAEIAWMRAYLKPMMDAGKLDVEEEFQQACFHISVYRSYLPTMPARRRVAEVAQLR